MAARKTPILLRRGPLSGEIYAYHRYKRTVAGNQETIDAATDGKQSVTADFDRLALEELCADAPQIALALSGAAQEIPLDDEERRQVGVFREHLVAMMERHNARLVA